MFQEQTEESMSQYETEVTEGVFPLGGVNDALAQYFSGTTIYKNPQLPVYAPEKLWFSGIERNARVCTLEDNWVSL